MTWTWISDDFFDSPPIYRLSRPARLLHIEALVWCNRHLSDGFLDRAALRRMTDEPDTDALVPELESAGLWQPRDGGWQLDWSDQERAEDVMRRKAANAERSRKYRRRREAHTRGDHTWCDPVRCRGNATRDATDGVTRDAPLDVAGGVIGDVSRGERSPLPSPPVPSRRDRDREGAGDPAPGGAAPGARESWPPWCEACDPETRTRTDERGRPGRCPECHPLGDVTGKRKEQTHDR